MGTVEEDKGGRRMKLRNRKGEIKKSWITLAAFMVFLLAIFVWHFLFVIPTAVFLFLFILQRIDEVDLLE